MADQLFCGLPLKTQKSLAKIKQKKRILKGNVITEIGGFSQNIYIHQNGQVKMTYNNELTKILYSRLVEKKEIIGLSQMISNSPNEMQTVTLSTCLFETIKFDDFLNFLQNEPDVSTQLLTLLGTDIQQNYQTFSTSIF